MAPGNSGRSGRTLRVDVLAYEGCFAAEIFGVLDLLTIANSVSAAVRPGITSPFRGRVVSVGGRAVKVSGGVVIRPDVAGGQVDQLVVPGSELVDVPTLVGHLDRLVGEVDYLRRFGKGRTTVASICLGAFLLAEAGLLDGCQATTSWLFASEFARRYPLVDVKAGALVVRDGRFCSSGAFSAVHDLALQLIRGHAGARIALMTAKLTLIATGRQSQSPFVDETMLPVAHATFSDDVRQWLRSHLSEPYSLSQLARQFHVSDRTLLRRFATETGGSPLGFLQGVRVSAARRLLETSDLSLQEITTAVGYGDVSTFRRLFTDRVGITPSDYRRQFSLETAPTASR